VVGFVVVIASSIFFCIQNVIVRVLFNDCTLFGVIQTGGFVSPTLQNSFLLMAMRMMWVVPLLALLASNLYAKSWEEIRQLTHSDHQRQLLHAVGGGFLMFTYLAFLYLAIGLIPTGIALTLFFTYPAFTALFSWRFFGVHPSRFRWLIMACVLTGSVLTIPFDNSSANSSVLGVCLGIASGAAYALYAVNAQKSFESIHPVPFTWLSFAIALLLSAFCVLIWFRPDGDLWWAALWVGGLLSAIATATGHLLNNLGIQLIGATSAAMIGSSNPALTVLLAWVAINESLNGWQLLGVFLVTLSVAALSQEKRLSHA
jgi:drug/metabolite transporter (DMT)-like permease